MTSFDLGEEMITKKLMSIGKKLMLLHQKL